MAEIVNASEIEVIAGSQLPEVSSPEGMTFLVYDGNSNPKETKRVSFDNMTPLFGVTSEEGYSATLAGSQAMVTSQNKSLSETRSTLGLDSENIIPENSRLDSNTDLVTDGSGKGIGAGVFDIRYASAESNSVVKNDDGSFRVSLSYNGSLINPAFWAISKFSSSYRGYEFGLSLSIRKISGSNNSITVNLNSIDNRLTIPLDSNWTFIDRSILFGSSYVDNRLMFYIPTEGLSPTDTSNLVFEIRDIRLRLPDGLIQEVNTLKDTTDTLGKYVNNLIPSNSTLDADTSLELNSSNKGIGAGIFALRYPTDSNNKVEKITDHFKVTLNSSGGSNPAFWAINHFSNSIREKQVKITFSLKGDSAGSILVYANTELSNVQTVQYITEWQNVSLDMTFGDIYPDNRLMIYTSSTAVFYIKDISMSLKEDTLSTAFVDLRARFDKVESELGPENINLSMANYLYKTARILFGDNAQAIIGLLGDSQTQHTWDHSKYVTPLAKALRTKYGDAGGGIYSFSMSNDGTAKMGSVDPDDATDTRSTTASGLIVYRDQVAGCRWVDAADATFNTGAFLELNILKPHDKLVIHFYASSASGVFTYKLDGGSVISVDTKTYPIGHNTIEIPTTDAVHTLRFDITQGSVMLFGVDMQRTNAGVRIHKIGNKGATTESYTIVDKDIWQQALISLGLDSMTVLLGTNDKYNGVPDQTVYDNLNTLIENIREVNPYIDLCLIQPSNTRVYDISSQAEYQFQLAKDKNVGYLNLIPLFGSPEQIIAKGTFYDIIHPTMQAGLMIANEINREVFK